MKLDISIINVVDFYYSCSVYQKSQFKDFYDTSQNWFWILRLVVYQSRLKEINILCHIAKKNCEIACCSNWGVF